MIQRRVVQNCVVLSITNVPISSCCSWSMSRIISRYSVIFRQIRKSHLNFHATEDNEKSCALGSNGRAGKEKSKLPASKASRDRNIALRDEDSATRLGSRCFRANPESTLGCSEVYHLENDHDAFTLKVDRGAWRLIATMVRQEEL